MTQENAEPGLEPESRETLGGPVFAEDEPTTSTADESVPDALLDLTRQYGDKKVEALSVAETGGDDEPYEREADALLARIEAEVQRLRDALANEREAEERANAELKDIVRRLDEVDVDSGGASERVGHAIQSMQRGWATAKENLARLETVKADRETVRGSLRHLKDTVTGPAIKALGVQHNEDIAPAIERFKAAAPGRTEQARTTDGDLIWQHIPCGWPHPWHPDATPDAGPDDDPSGCHKPGPWRPLLVATDAPRQDGPLVLTLPEVPDGTVAAIGLTTRDRYTMKIDDRYYDRRPTFEIDGWWGDLGELLSREPHGVTVELAPPREPRTWPKIAATPADLTAVRGESGTVYRRHAITELDRWAAPADEDGHEDWRSLAHWQRLDGPLTEVLDEPGAAT